MPVSEGVWSAIEQNLERQDRRPLTWFLFAGLLTLMPLAFFIAFYTQDSGQEQKHQSLAYMETFAQEANMPANLYRHRLDYAAEIQDRSIDLRFGAVNNTAPRLGFQIASGLKNEHTFKTGKETNSKPNYLLASVPELQSGYVQEIRKPKFMRTGSDCPDFRASLPGLYSYTQAGTSLPFQSLKSSGSEMSELISQRNATESPLPSFSFEAGLGYEFYNGFFIQAGLMYNQINTRFLHRQEDIINNTTSIIIDTMFNIEGEILSITRDTSVIQEIGVREVAATNTFKMIDIPVSIGYLYPINEKFQLRATAGVAFNLRMRSSGYMINYDSDPFRYGNQGDNTLFRDKLSLSYLAGLGLETELAENLYLNAGISMRYFPGTFNLESNPVDQRFINLGLSAGLKYRI